MSRSLRSPEANRDGGSVPLRTLGRPPNPSRRIKTIGAGPAEADHVAGRIVEPRFAPESRLVARLLAEGETVRLEPLDC